MKPQGSTDLLKMHGETTNKTSILRMTRVSEVFSLPRPKLFLFRLPSYDCPIRRLLHPPPLSLLTQFGKGLFWRPGKSWLQIWLCKETTEKDDDPRLCAVPQVQQVVPTLSPKLSHPNCPSLFIAGDGLPHLSTALIGEPLAITLSLWASMGTPDAAICCVQCSALWCK